MSSLQESIFYVSNVSGWANYKKIKPSIGKAKESSDEALIPAGTPCI